MRTVDGTDEELGTVESGRFLENDKTLEVRGSSSRADLSSEDKVSNSSSIKEFSEVLDVVVVIIVNGKAPFCDAARGGFGISHDKEWTRIYEVSNNRVHLIF